jgi:hypothetical protein
MPDDLVRIRTPEDDALDQKRDELHTREAELVEKELELSTIRAELLQFRGLYILKVGWLQVELDNLRAARARWRAVRKPWNVESERRAREAERRAGKSRKEYEQARAETAPYVHRIEPTAELKLTYRRLARTYHPDLAADVDEIARRNRLMAKINAAYAAGDLHALQQIEHDEEMAPAAVRGHDLTSEIQRFIRMIYQVERRIQEIDELIRSTKLGDDWALYVRCKQARKWGGDVLEQMARGLRAQIAAERARDKGVEFLDELAQKVKAKVAGRQQRKQGAAAAERMRRILRTKDAPEESKGAKPKRPGTKGGRPGRGSK